MKCPWEWRTPWQPGLKFAPVQARWERERRQTPSEIHVPPKLQNRFTHLLVELTHVWAGPALPLPTLLTGLLSHGGGCPSVTSNSAQGPVCGVGAGTKIHLLPGGWHAVKMSGVPMNSLAMPRCGRNCAGSSTHFLPRFGAVNAPVGLPRELAVVRGAVGCGSHKYQSARRQNRAGAGVMCSVPACGNGRSAASAAVRGREEVWGLWCPLLLWRKDLGAGNRAEACWWGKCEGWLERRYFSRRRAVVWKAGKNTA